MAKQSFNRKVENECEIKVIKNIKKMKKVL